MTVKIAAVAHSKHRNMFGLVGIEIDTEIKKIYVKLARQWTRDQINQIPEDIGNLFRKIKWGDTFIDQETGQSLIRELRQQQLTVKIITTQKNVKDPQDKPRIMDKIEMAQFMIKLKTNHQLEFPPKPSKDMTVLENQMSVYSEHTTESGGLDYFAPGDEKDNLTKGLFIACFAGRMYIEDGELKFIPIESIDTNPISVLNKEVLEGKTGLSWNQVG